MAGVLPNAESPIRSALNALDADDLFALETEMDELKDSRAWEALIRLMGEGRAVVEKFLLRGTKEHVEYASLTGYINGLDTFLAVSDEVGKVAKDRRAKIQADADQQAARERANA
jgi:hypothetical protein